MKKTDVVKQLIAELNAKKAGTVQLNPVMALKEVRAFEKKYRVSLPGSYVEFITQIGDGAVIQSDTCGTQELLALGSYESRKHPKERIGLPFPLERSWMPDWGDGIEGIDDKEDEDIKERLMAKQWEKIETRGNLSILVDRTCNSEEWVLITAGTCRGEIWQISQYGIFRLAKCNFAHWIELLLTNGLKDFMAECKKAEYPQEEDQLEFCRNFVKKEKIVMNPPASFEEIYAFEKRHNISFPGEYVTFLSEIGNGAKKSPWYLSEIYSLSDNDSLEDLAQPFFIQTKSDYIRILEKGRKRCNEPGGKNIWEYLFKREDYEDKNAKSPWVLPQFQLMHGCIPIIGKGTPSDNHDIIRQYILILNGDYKGEIWSVEADWIEPAYNTEMPANVLTVMRDIAYGGY